MKPAIFFCAKEIQGEADVLTPRERREDLKVNSASREESEENEAGNVFRAKETQVEVGVLTPRERREDLKMASTARNKNRVNETGNIFHAQKASDERDVLTAKERREDLQVNSAPPQEESKENEVGNVFRAKETQDEADVLTNKERREYLKLDSKARDENSINDAGKFFCSQETLDEEEVLAQLIPVLEKAPKTVSELVHELCKSSEFASTRKSTRPSAQKLSSMLETVESVVELAPNVEHYEMPAAPFSCGPQLPSWVDTCAYSTANSENAVSNSWAPLPEKAPYGLLLRKYEKEFRELMN